MTDIVLGGLIALLGGAIGVFAFLTWRYNRAVDPDEAMQRFGLPVYAAAPHLNPRSFRQLPPGRRTEYDFVLERPQSDYAAAFRRLGDMTTITGADEHVLAVTAPRARDGGGATALALARTLAMEGKRVALIDCDTRLRSLTRLLALKPEHGVIEVLNGRVSWREAMEIDPRSYVRILAATSAGMEPASSVFERPAFANLLAQIQAEHDVIVLSCPSVFGLAVTPLLMNKASRGVLVVKWAKSPPRHVSAALRTLRRFRAAPRMGLMLVDVPNTPRFRQHMLSDF